MAKEKNKSKKNKEIVIVESRPIENKNQAAPERVENIKIDNITLNIFAKPFKKRYEKHYKEDKIHLLIDIVLGVIVLILIGVILNLWLFSRTKLINLIDFTVTASPVNLTNGSQAEFSINYTNTTKNTLTDVSLVLKRPEALRDPSYNIADFDSKTNTLKIGDLASKAHGEFKITGLLLGNLNDKHEFLAVINYKNKFGQTRQEFFSQNFQLTDSVLATQINLPNKIIATSPFETKVNLKNKSALDFADLKIKMIWPAEFSFNQTDLEKPLAENIWAIGSFTTNQESEYTFSGKAYIDNPQNINFQTEIYATYNNREYLLAKAQSSVFVDFSKFKLSLINLENNQSITPGGKTTYTLFYKNEENYDVANVELGLNLSGEYAASRQIRVNQNDYQRLTNIAAGQEGTIELTATAKSIINYTNEKPEGFNIETRGFASYDDPIENTRISVESSPVLSPVSSSLTLKTTGVFFTPLGDQIGVGSVPPVVDEYTSYWIIIKAVNTHHQAKAVKITAQIPGGVEFTDTYNVTAGNQIVKTGNTLSWTIDSIPAFAGIFSPAPEARIQLAITPSLNQVGTSPVLLTNITATATDTRTGAFLTAVGKNISTAIFADDFLNKVIE